MIKTLLFPTKFREGALAFLKKLLVLKNVGLEEVRVLHVIEKDKVSFDYAGYLKEVEEKLRKAAEEKLSEWEAELSGEVKVSSKIVVGIPEYEILAESKQCDLVAAGKPTSGFIRKLFFGSTTLNFLAEIEKPTILARLSNEFILDQRGLFEKVVFATDGSEPCKRALAVLKELGKVIGEVELISVANTEKNEKLEMFEEMINSFKSELEASNIKTKINLLRGKPSREIVRLAEGVKATLIVMGTTGKDRFEELVLGSASHRVIEMSKVIPVMLVP